MLKTIDLKELLVPIPEKSLQEEHTVLHKKVIELVKAKNNLEEEIEETIASFWDQQIGLTLLGMISWAALKLT